MSKTEQLGIFLHICLIVYLYFWYIFILKNLFLDLSNISSVQYFTNIMLRKSEEKWHGGKYKQAKYQVELLHLIWWFPSGRKDYLQRFCTPNTNEHKKYCILTIWKESLRREFDRSCKGVRFLKFFCKYNHCQVKWLRYCIRKNSLDFTNLNLLVSVIDIEGSSNNLNWNFFF